MEWVKYSGREEGGGVETTRVPCAWPVVLGREDAAPEIDERDEREEANGEETLPMNEDRRP